MAMSRLTDQQHAAMDRNRTALLMSCSAFEPMVGDNHLMAVRDAHCEDREAQFDIEGAIDWRHAQPKWEARR
jgi:hypothetical protein